MKKLFACLAAILLVLYTMGQNVGVNTNTPTEKLDVNGNINLSGQLKVNSNQGLAGQVLMKNASNNLVWADLNEFQNHLVLDCSNTALTFGANNCASTWTVPAGVTKIAIELWGGGGGGANLSGGGGGGYLLTKLVVTPGLQASLEVAAGGNGSITSPISGGNSTVSFPGIFLSAGGGSAGTIGDPTTIFNVFHSAWGGSYSVFGITSNYIGFQGEPGKISKLSFMTAGTSDFARIINYGDGGGAALFHGTGGTGAYRIISTSLNQTTRAMTGGYTFGGGGGGDPTAGGPGKGGRIVIHY